MRHLEGGGPAEEQKAGVPSFQPVAVMAGRVCFRTSPPLLTRVLPPRISIGAAPSERLLLVHRGGGQRRTRVGATCRIGLLPC